MNLFLKLCAAGYITLILSSCTKQEQTPLSPVVHRNDPFFQDDRVVLPKNQPQQFNKQTPAIQRIDTRDLNLEK